MRKSSLINFAVMQNESAKIFVKFVTFLQKSDLFIACINIFIIFAAEI